MKIFYKVAGLLVLLFTLIPTVSFAAETANSKTLNPWIDCGIGAMIFDNTAWAAAISNVIWDLGSTAVTSNLSSQNTCNGKNAKVALFIGTTYANLEDETVKGSGKHLDAMLNIMNCDSTAHSDIIGSVRVEFARSLRDASYSEKTSLVKAQEYYNIVQTKVNGEYAHQCHAI
jgi:hypothetical protein